MKPAFACAAIMLPALSCFAFATPAHAGNANGQSKIVVNQGVTISKNSDLHFGDFIAGTVRSDFRLIPSTGAIDQRSGNAVHIGGGPTAASFTATGQPNLRVRITVDENQINIVRDGGAETMRVNRFRFDINRNQFLDSATGQVTYQVGGQLRINANQASGTYRGTFNVTIDYN